MKVVDKTLMISTSFFFLKIVISIPPNNGVKIRDTTKNDSGNILIVELIIPINFLIVLLGILYAFTILMDVVYIIKCISNSVY